MRKRRKLTPMPLFKVGIGSEIYVLRKHLVVTDEVGLQYRVVCKDQDGRKHQIRQETPVYVVET